MDDYNWLDYEFARPEHRFAAVNWVIGRIEWSDGLRGLLLPLQPMAAPDGWKWIDTLRAVRPVGPPHIRCPRLFVSHRQNDEDWARRIAWLANSMGFDFWLDVIDLDPQRNTQVKNWEALLGRNLTKLEIGILTAAIIEMALLNCTHVIAVMTQNTLGSAWVPYEYGRAKERQLTSTRVSSWLHPHLPHADLAEYMNLGVLNNSESDIVRWLQQEMISFPSCPRVGRDGGWGSLKPEPLPAKQPKPPKP